MKKEDIILIITFTVFLVLFLWYVFGDSPTFEQLITGVILAQFGWISQISSKISEHIGEHRGYEKARGESSG